MGAFDPERILRALSRRRVRYVLVGATAARLQGFPRLTADADIAPAADPDNLTRLAAALRAPPGPAATARAQGTQCGPEAREIAGGAGRLSVGVGRKPWSPRQPHSHSPPQA